jgi:hypothetical protein
MNAFQLCLATAALWLTAASAPAAPVPARAAPSQGPVSDALALRDLLPTTAAPVALRALMTDERSVELHRPTFKAVAVTEVVQQVEYRAVEKTRTVKKGEVLVTEKVIEYVPVTREVPVTVTKIVPSDKVQKETVPAGDCKFFTVTREGRLEAITAGAAAARLKTATGILTGASAEIDSRYLELVRPGTLYVVTPEPGPLLVPRIP